MYNCVTVQHVQHEQKQIYSRENIMRYAHNCIVSFREVNLVDISAQRKQKRVSRRASK